MQMVSVLLVTPLYNFKFCIHALCTCFTVNWYWVLAHGEPYILFWISAFQNTILQSTYKIQISYFSKTAFLVDQTENEDHWNILFLFSKRFGYFKKDIILSKYVIFCEGDYSIKRKQTVSKKPTSPYLFPFEWFQNKIIFMTNSGRKCQPNTGLFTILASLYHSQILSARLLLEILSNTKSSAGHSISFQ